MCHILAAMSTVTSWHRCAFHITVRGIHRSPVDCPYKGPGATLTLMNVTSHTDRLWLRRVCLRHLLWWQHEQFLAQLYVELFLRIYKTKGWCWYYKLCVNCAPSGESTETKMSSFRRNLIIWNEDIFSVRALGSLVTTAWAVGRYGIFIWSYRSFAIYKLCFENR